MNVDWSRSCRWPATMGQQIALHARLLTRYDVASQGLEAAQARIKTYAEQLVIEKRLSHESR